ncbi:MAG: M48 family metalloprotease [Pseudomonadota bacterium]
MFAALLLGGVLTAPAHAAPAKKTAKPAASAAQETAAATAATAAAAAAAAAATAAAAAPAVSASEASAAASTSAPTDNSPGLFDRVKSMFGGGAGGDEADKAKAAPPAEKSDKADKAEKADEPSFFSRLTGGGSSASKVKDIDEVFPNSAREFDPSCKSMVEPFGMTDNMLSLAKLGAKLAINNASARYGFGGQAMDLRGTLKLAGKNLNWLPMEAERMLGEKVHGEMAAELLDGERKPNRVLLQRAALLMQTLLAQLKEETPYKFQIDVRKGAGNAQALPGGFLLIDRDLVAVPKNEDKAYFALAHEMAHVLQRHETRATQARLTDSIDSLDGLRKLMDGANRTPASLMAFSNEVMMRFVVFSKDQEMQADACAVRLLDAAFTDKKKLHQIIRSYQASLAAPSTEAGVANQLDLFVRNVGKMDKLGEQHPNSQDRAANLERMLNEVGKAKTAAAAAPVAH